MTSIPRGDATTLEEIAREAGNLLLTLYDTELEEQSKGHHDFATNADVQSQKLILKRIREADLSYAIVAEEKDSDAQFPLVLGRRGILYVDPLEGTHNFTRKRKELGFGVTLGVVVDGYPCYVVFYNAATRELCVASKGYGAHIDGATVHVSQRRQRLDLLFNHWPNRKYVGKYLDKLRSLADYTPTTASDAVDMWMVAKGAADGLVYIYRTADPWDLMHAVAIEEAGGKVSDIHGGPWFARLKGGYIKPKNSMLAGNPYVHELLLRGLSA